MYHIAWWAGWYRIGVPSCPGCRVWLFVLQAWDATLTLSIAVAALLFGLFVLDPIMPGWVAGLITLGLIVAAFVAVHLWNRAFPAALRVCNLRHLGFVDFEFRDQQLARLFRELNVDHVIECAPSNIE